MQANITDVIVWLSPVAGGLLVWFIHDLITTVRTDITQVKGELSETNKELSSVNKSIVKIQTDIEYLKDRDKIDKKRNDEFEDHVVRVLKRAKGRFE